MAGMSKNNPDKRNTSVKGKIVLSDDCEKCTQKCGKGESYLKSFTVKKQGNGVWCKK